MTISSSSPAFDGPDGQGVPRTGRLGTRTVSRVGYGAMQLERLRDDRADAIALVRRAVESGVDHIDTAQFYGDGFVNGVLRDALRPDDGVTVVTKIGADPDPGGPFPMRVAQRPEELRASVEANLRSLGVERLDVVNLRRMDGRVRITVPPEQRVDLDDQLAVMAELRDAGVIGEFGLSSTTLEVLQRAVPAGLACVQNDYNLLARDDEAMLQLCTAAGIAWVPFFPLGGAFRGMSKVTDEPAVRAAAETLGVSPAQVGLAWLLHHAPNILLIPGTANADHLDDNLAVRDIRLDEATMVALDAIPPRPAGRLG